MFEIATQRYNQVQQRHATTALRYALAFVFFWFGITKPLSISPADAVVMPTFAATPLLDLVLTAGQFFAILGFWEAFVGITLLWRRTIRLAVACMCVQMASTFVPFLVIPGETFAWWPLVPSTIGLYIVKNFVLASAGLFVLRDARPLVSWGPVVSLRRRLVSVHPSLASHDLVRSIRATLRTDGRRVLRQSEQLAVAHAPTLLRGGLTVVFVVAGLLSVMAISEPGLWLASSISEGVASESVVQGLWGAAELGIGAYVALGNRLSTRIAVVLAHVYIVLAIIPIVLAPGQVWASFPFSPTFEGVFLFKDFVLLAAVIALDADMCFS